MPSGCKIPGQTGGLPSAFATCIHCPPGRDNSSSTCSGLESTKRQRNRWRAYVPFALSHLDCSAANGQMIVWSNGHPTRWRERSIARGSNSAPPYSMRLGVSIRLPTQACPLGMSIHLRVQRLSSRRHERLSQSPEPPGPHHHCDHEKPAKPADDCAWDRN